MPQSQNNINSSKVMLIKFYSLCIVCLFCEAATKIGLGNGRPSEEPSSLKTEVLKYKSSECGSSSSEEQPRNNRNKKQKNRNKKESDEDDDDDDDDSEEDNKKKNKNNGGKNNNNNNNRGRQKNNRGFNREDMFTGYGSTSFEHNRHFGMNRGPQDDYMNRRLGPGGIDQFPNRWEEDQNRTPYNPNPRGNHGTQFNPYGPSFGGDDEFNPQNSDRRNQNHGRDPYGPRPGSMNNRGGYPHQQDRGDDRYNNKDNRHNNRDDRYSNRRRPQQNNWDDSSSEDDSSRNSGKRNGQRNNRRPNSRHGGMRDKNTKNKNENSDGECTSQCVFNNMQIMEDDGIPSEAGMIKWAQEKIKNEKLKQSAVKEIRKCFGTLASSDGDNSCNFSKSLSHCLKLGLDEDKD